MNRKHILVLSVILGVLVLGVAVRSLTVRHNSRGAGAVYTPPAFVFDPQKIERIEIGRGTKAAPVILIKENGVWKVRTFWDARADRAKVAELLEGLRNMKGELRSSDPAVLADFGITDADAFFVKMTGAGNQTLLDLRAGSKKAGYEGTFVRRADSPEVYFTGTGLDRLLGIYLPADDAVPGSGFWADLALFDLDPEKVSRIEISNVKDGTSMLSSRVERAEEVWRLVGPYEKAAVDPEKVIGFIATLNSVRAQNIEDPAGKNYGLERPVWRLTVTENDGLPAGREGAQRPWQRSEAQTPSRGVREFILEAGPQRTKDNVYFMKFRDRPEIFRMTAYYFEDLNVKNDKFIKTEAAESAT